MKIPQIPQCFIVCCAGLCCVGTGLVSTPAAETWSAAQEIGIPSAAGPLTVAKQSLALDNRIGAEVVDLLYAPATKAAWIGLSQPQYFGLGSSLWSVAPGGSSLLLRPSSAVLPPGEVTSFADRWVAQYRQGRSDWWTPQRGTLAFNLSYIFGDGTLGAVHSGFLGNRFTLSNLEVTPNGVTFTVRSRSGNDLRVSFGSDFTLLSVVQNGTPVLALFDGRMPRPGGTEPWNPPKRVFVQGATGQVPVTASDKTVSFQVGDPRLSVYEKQFDAKAAERDQAMLQKMNLGLDLKKRRFTLYGDARALVFPSGDIWIGPAGCKVALVGDKIIGFGVNTPTQDLMAFVGPRTRILLADGERIPAFQRVLTQFEADIDAGRYVPDKAIKIASLFNNDRTFAQDDLGLQQLAFEGNNLVLTIRHGQGRENLVIKLTPDLAVVSAVRNVDQPPTELTNPPPKDN